MYINAGKYRAMQETIQLVFGDTNENIKASEDEIIDLLEDAGYSIKEIFDFLEFYNY